MYDTIDDIIADGEFIDNIKPEYNEDGVLICLRIKYLCGAKETYYKEGDCCGGEWVLYEEEEEEEEQCPCCSCSECGGPREFLGQLGSLYHYRCRDCGWEDTGPAAEEEE